MRIRRGWRQADVARVAGVSDSTISRIERGHLDALTLKAVRAVAAALEVTVELLPRSRAAALDRMVSSAHAALGEQVVAWISSLDGWIVRPEVSFSRYGERGVIDLLAWHVGTSSLLVIELKTEIVDIGELLGTLDRKLRNAGHMARGLGWEAASIGGLLVIGESATNRRRIATHAATFDAALPDRFVRVRTWLRAPTGAVRGLIFFADRHPRTAGQRISTVRRVRTIPTRDAAENRARNSTYLGRGAQLHRA
jgi:transcriptional regulator with XRE-family HTH domain